MKQNYVLSSSQEGYHKVAYTEWGVSNSDNSAVICVHGLTRNGRDFDALANYLSTQGHHVFCPDVIGRGDSSWLKNAREYNFGRYLTDMNVLMSRTGASQIDWVGTSMGGLIGIMIAALPHTPIRRLILNDVSPQVPIQALWQLAKYVGKDPQFSSKEQAKDYYKQIYSEFGILTEEEWDQFTENSVVEQSPSVFISKLDPRIIYAKSKWDLMKDFFHHPHKALEGIFFDIDMWDIWKNVKCPVLVIHGYRSILLLPEHIKKMQQTHPHVEVLEIKNAGHAPALLELDQHEKIGHWLASSSVM